MRSVALACLLGLAGCSRVAPPTPLPQVSAPEQSVASVPSEQQLGVPYYPGAKAVAGGATADLVDAQFATKDSIDQVVSFYKGNIPGATATGDKNESMIEFRKDGATYSIDLHRDRREGVTLFSINARK